MNVAKRIILASQSPSRALILEGAGINFNTVPADLDESRLIAENLSRGLKPAEIGKLLANAKAAAVSGKPEHKDILVLGADQILLCDSEIFEKPANLEEAKKTLEKLRGKTHTLLACVAACINSEKVFEICDEAHLTMRDFSDDFLEQYLQDVGEKILSSVGAYQLEDRGAQLFEKIEGDFFTILGLPLFPVLDFLRRRGALGG